MTQAEWFKWNEVQNNNWGDQAELTRGDKIKIIEDNKVSFEKTLDKRYKDLIGKNDIYDLSNTSIDGKFKQVEGHIINLLTADWQVNPDRLLKLAELIFTDKDKLNSLLNSMKPAEPKEIAVIMWDAIDEAKESPNKKLIDNFAKALDGIGLEDKNWEIKWAFLNALSNHKWENKISDLNQYKLSILLNNEKIKDGDLSTIERSLSELLKNWKISKEINPDTDKQRIKSMMAWINGEIADENATEQLTRAKLKQEQEQFKKEQIAQKRRNKIKEGARIAKLRRDKVGNLFN
jgi:hypothetical protein